MKDDRIFKLNRQTFMDGTTTHTHTHTPIPISHLLILNKEGGAECQSMKPLNFLCLLIMHELISTQIQCPTAAHPFWDLERIKLSPPPPIFNKGNRYWVMVSPPPPPPPILPPLPPPPAPPPPPLPPQPQLPPPPPPLI